MVKLVAIGFVVVMVGLELLSLDENKFLQAWNSTTDAQQPRAPRNTKKQLASFDPFTDFRFLIPRAAQEADDSYYSSHRCVGTGTQYPQPGWKTNGQSEGGSNERRRPNFVNRQCHYRNLYYRLTDQTFHYFASPKESKAFRESRMTHGETVEDSEALLQRKYKEHLFDGRHQGNETNFLQYHRDLDEIKEEGSVFSYSELVDRMAVQIDTALENENPPFRKWRPILHEYSPTKNVSLQLPSFTILDISSNEDQGMGNKTEFYFSLYHPSHSFNVGHLMWDDILSIYSLYDRLAYNDNRKAGPTPSNDLIIPFHVELPHRKKGLNHGGPDAFWRCSPANHVKWAKCVVTYKRLFESLTGVQVDKCSGDILRSGNWLRGDETIGVWTGHPKDDSCISPSSKNTTADRGRSGRDRNKLFLKNNQNEIEYVLIPNVLAGGGRLSQFACDDSCSIGRGMELYRFRNYLFRNILATSTSKENEEKAGYIVFSLPSNSSRPNDVYHFETEIEEATLQYGVNVVRAVDLSTLSLAEQARLLDQTAVFITNHGGGAMGATLLPRGSSLLNFWHGKYRFDHVILESSNYFRTIWIGAGERSSTNRTMAIIDYQYHQTLLEWQK